MSASGYEPVPSAPGDRGWEPLEGYLADVRLDAEWSVPPDYETLGRLTSLRADLDTDVGYLTDLREQLDELIVRLAGSKRDAEYQENRDAR